MVKGVSRQVIVLHAPDPQLFEQVIFILNDRAIGKAGVTDETLLKEANRLLHTHAPKEKGNPLYGPVWACAGALIIGAIWLVSTLL